MRALLIDPKQRTVTEVQTDGEYTGIRRLIGCRSIEGAMMLNGSIFKGGDMLYCDEEGLFADNPRYFFAVDGGQPIAGKGLVEGVDKDGESCDATTGVAELTQRIAFTQRKVRGVRTMIIPGGIEVEADMPLIDGTDERAE